MSDQHLGFFYGTLRSGGRRFPADDRKVVWPEAYINGYRMYDVGSFPGIVAGEGRIRGEVQSFDTAVLERLDYYEGYRKNSPENSLYRRIRVMVEHPDGALQTETWLYVFNHSIEDLELVDSGDWFQYRNLYQKEAK